jgi:hypothetical protein
LVNSNDDKDEENRQCKRCGDMESRSLEHEYISISSSHDYQEEDAAHYAAEYLVETLQCTKCRHVTTKKTTVWVRYD